MRALFALLFTSLVVVPSSAQACSCMLGAANSAFDKSPHVFVARITAVEDVAVDSRWKRWSHTDPKDRRVGVNYGLRMRFAVETTIKGEPESLSQLVTGYGDGDCGVPTLPGGYLLIATDDRGEVRYCGIAMEMRLLSCTDIERIDRMRRRAHDGVTDVTLSPFAVKDAEPGRLREWIVSGRDPFTLTVEECPVVPTSEADRS